MTLVSFGDTSRLLTAVASEVFQKIQNDGLQRGEKWGGLPSNKIFTPILRERKRYRVMQYDRQLSLFPLGRNLT